MRVGSTALRSVHVSGFASFCLLTPQCRLYPLPVRRASALPPASFRPPVTRGALAVQLTLPRVGPVEDFHLQESAPCRAHKKRRRVSIPGGLIRGRSGSLARPSVSASNGVCRTLTEAYNDESTRRPRGAPEGAGPDLRIATRKPQRARKDGTRSGCLRKDDRIVGSGCA